MDLSKLPPEQQKELEVEVKFYAELGIELERLDETPKPLQTIKETLKAYGIKESDIDTIFMMSYNITKSIEYIYDYHKDDLFKIVIYGHEDTFYYNLKDPRIQQIPTSYRPTEHFNLIKLKNGKHIKATDVKSKAVDENTEYMLFVEPFHNGDNFGPAYETKLSSDATEYDKISFELLKAKLFIPNQNTIKLINQKFSAA